MFDVQIVKSTIEDETTLTYTCDHNGVASIEGVNLNRTYILTNESKHIYCRPTFNNLKNCYDTGEDHPQRSTQLKVLYEHELNSKLVGGKQPYYFNLTCVDSPQKLTANASFTQTKFNENYDNKKENVHWTETLVLKISKDKEGNQEIKDLEIGQALFLVMTGPDNYTISPESCYAKPTQGQDSDGIKMWQVTTDDKCNDTEEAIIDGKWSFNQKKLSIKMYGFKFVNSEDVTVTCTALVCPSASSKLCKQLCVDGVPTNSRRRRSAVETSTHSQKSAKVSFRVRTREKTNGATGLTPNAVVYTFGLFLLIIEIKRHVLF